MGSFYYSVSRTSNGGKHAVPGSDALQVSITEAGTLKNTVIKTGADANMVVKQYFDKDIFKFYFFDGERLRDYFNANEKKAIKQSIFNISQVSLVESACLHLEKAHKDCIKECSGLSLDIASLEEKRFELEKRREDAIRSKEENQRLVDNRTAELERINANLRDYEPVRQLQKERDLLNANLFSIEREEKDLNEKRRAFIRNYTIWLNLYPRIRKTLSMIEEKEQAGEMPPSIDKDLIYKLIEDPKQRCPICNTFLDHTSLEHLHILLDQFSLSSATSNYLKEIKGSLEEVRERVDQYPILREEIRQAVIDIKDRKDKVEARLREISSYLLASDVGPQVHTQDLENRRIKLIKENNTAYTIIGATEEQIKNYDREIQEEKRKIADALKEEDKRDALLKKVSAIEMLLENLKRIKATIASQMREEIETTTWTVFDSMIWKKDTFKEIKISDDYGISVYHKNGEEMRGSLGATEAMALAYAFTLAIHKASGKNCPLVIDSPLGRVSDENREKMAAALKKVSKDKQVIMLFTPDEYSVQVKAEYEGYADVHTLELSEDENYVKGVER